MFEEGPLELFSIITPHLIALVGEWMYYPMANHNTLFAIYTSIYIFDCMDSYSSMYTSRTYSLYI